MSRTRAFWTARLATAALVISGLNACSTELASDLDEAQAGEIVLALDEAGIGAERERQDASRSPVRYRVVVPRIALPSALAVMRDQELPREREEGWSSLFEETSLVPSASQEHVRHAAALAGELARSIEEMPAVTRARVHLALPETLSRPLDDESPSARGSVLVTFEANTSADTVTAGEAAIRTLVAGAVNDLEGDAIAVVTNVERVRPQTQTSLVWIGPVAVSRGSASALKGILGGSFALNLLLAGALFYARRRWSVAR